MMEPVTVIEGTAAPLPLKDVDTDMIIPAQYLTSISREGFGTHLFRRLRDQDSEFPLNLAKYRDAPILVTGSNFGCGSSREHAVWALLGAGIRAVIAPSFADIFFSNAAKNGLLLITLDEKEVDRICVRATADLLHLRIDLAAQEIQIEGERHGFHYEPFRKHCLMQGLDDLDYILEQRGAISEYFKRARPRHYFLKDS
jgi:3-isopropylmalate/(R)-2-methylmalate dehydratase small subunit